MIFKIYLVGLAVLATAIILNIVAKMLNISTWYDFLQNKSIKNVIDVIWLFIIYPAALGLVAFVLYKFTS